MKCLCAVKVIVWTTINAKRIMGPFLYKTNFEYFVTSILTHFYGHFTEDKITYGCFTQNNATAHIANASVNALVEAFGD